MRAGGGQEVMQDASRLGQAANLAEHRRRQGARDASKLAPVEGSQTAPGAQAEERAQGTAWSMVRLASAPVGRKRAHRKPLIDPGKRVRKACLKLKLGEKAPALTVSQLRMLLDVVLPRRALMLEDVLKLVAWVQRRNHGAYRSHKKRRASEG